MGKPQVTIAVQAYGLTGPVHTPYLLVSLGVQGDAYELVLLIATQSGLKEVGRYAAPLGPLKASTADCWSAIVGDAAYLQLCMACGVQGQLEDLPISASPPAV